MMSSIAVYENSVSSFKISGKMLISSFQNNIYLEEIEMMHLIRYFAIIWIIIFVVPIETKTLCIIEKWVT